MSWDFTEINPIENAPGNWSNHVEWVSSFLDKYPSEMPLGEVKKLDATQAIYDSKEIICSTDPPYYDNIGYANLSDFFYIWLRRTLQTEYPDLFSTLMTPKMNELIADPGKYEGNREKSERHFEDGMLNFFTLLGKRVNPKYPVTERAEGPEFVFKTATPILHISGDIESAGLCVFKNYTEYTTLFNKIISLYKEKKFLNQSPHLLFFPFQQLKWTKLDFASLTEKLLFGDQKTEKPLKTEKN